jgi:hypothetical protein
MNPGDDDNLLADDLGGKSSDIIESGEKIAEKLGKVKTTNPTILAN